MATNRFPALRELDFGRLDAGDEAAVPHSRLLTDGYYDHNGVARGIAAGGTWLVIGPKGSGKSAAFEHLRLVWDKSPMHFFHLWPMGGWPVGDVTGIKMGLADGAASAQGAWEFLLLLRLFDSLTCDQGASVPGEVLRLRRELEASGLLGNVDLRTRFFDWARSTVKFSVAGLGAEGSHSDVSATLFQIAEYIRAACRRIATSSIHRVALDGLDQFFAESDADWRSLAGLVHAVQSVNIFFKGLRQNVGVVVAIRSEVFASLPSTDSAKLLDHSIRLDWTDSGFDSRNRLWEMVNQKALVSVLEGFGARPFKDLRRDYLGERMTFGKFDQMPQYLLSHTRLLPRDMVALLRRIQEVHPGATPVHPMEAREAVRRYSEEYFVAEVFNSLHGSIDDSIGRKVMSFKESLASLPRRIFSASELAADLRGVLDADDLRAPLRRLYDIGAIGVRRGTPPNVHTDFVFRRYEGGSFNFRSEYALHSSLVIAWNVPG